jgi:ABC-type nitrate/sulfonate/bicarbonate transport system substrate-binding protein
MHLACGYATEGQGVTPLAAAVEDGAFERAGFDVTLDKLGDAGAVSVALAEGRIAFGNLAAPGLVYAVSSGARLAFIAGGVNQQFLVGRPGTAGIDALAGGRLAASRAHDLTDFLVQLTCERLLAGRFFETAFVGGSQARIDSLLGGTVAASPLSPPLAVTAKRQGCPWLFDYGEWDLNFAIGGIAVGRSLLESDHALVDAFLRCYLEGQTHYKADREFGIRVHEKYGGVDRADAEETYDVTHAGFRDVPDPATDGLQLLVDFWKQRGVIAGSLTRDDVVDSAPVLRITDSAR